MEPGSGQEAPITVALHQEAQKDEQRLVEVSADAARRGDAPPTRRRK